MLRGREVQFAWNVGRMLLCIREDLATRRKTCRGWEGKLSLLCSRTTNLS